jgi:hypothetical protein
MLDDARHGLLVAQGSLLKLDLNVLLLFLGVWKPSAPSQTTRTCPPARSVVTCAAKLGGRARLPCRWPQKLLRASQLSACDGRDDLGTQSNDLYRQGFASLE